MTVVSVFTHCVQAIRRGELIRRVSSTDKEFHFQNWFRDRLTEMGMKRMRFNLLIDADTQQYKAAAQHLLCASHRQRYVAFTHGCS